MPHLRPRRTLAAAAAVLASSAWASTAGAATPPLYVANEGANTVSVINTSAGSVEQNITVGTQPQAVVFSPDGSTAYVVNYGSGTVSVIATHDQSVTDTVEVGQSTYSVPESLALSPDGAKLYVTFGYRADTPYCPGNPPAPGTCPGEVAVFDTANIQAPPAYLKVGDVPMGIAITPDGTKAFVADSGSGQVTEIENLNTDPTVDPTPINVGGMPNQVAVTPGGKTVYVTNSSENAVSTIDPASGKVTAVSDPKSTLAGPIGVATNPDGGSAYVANFDSTSPGILSVLDTAKDAVSGTVQGLDAHPYGVAYSPGGKTAYVSESNQSSGGTIRAVNTQSGSVTGPSIPVDTDPLGLAVAPDQAPKAALTVTAAPAGQATTLDTTGSSVAYGSIVSYAWNFGDGTTCTYPQTQTCGAITHHTYAKPGNYTASVTETDSSGTSTTRVFTGQMVLRNGGPSATASQPVDVQAAAPIGTTTPSSLDFGTQTVFWSYPAKTVSLSNTGNAPLKVSAVGITGTNASDFAVDSDACSGHSLPAGASCQVLVRFVPGYTTGLGAKSATLQFTDNAANSPQSVPLSGISQLYVSSGQQPAFSMAPDRLDFADTAPGAHSQTQRFTVTNTGNEPMSISDVSLTGKDPHQFKLLSGTCRGASVAPAASCLIYVQFRPTAFGHQNALVQIDDNAPGSPHIAQVTGTAVGAKAVLAPTHLAFGNQRVEEASKPRTIQVTNAGNRPLEVRKAAIQGPNAKAFKLNTDACSGKTLKAGERCDLGVSFRPTARGALTAEIALADNGVGGPDTVTLSGRGIAPTVNLSPVGIVFGSVRIGSHSAGHTVTLTNRGDAALHIKQILLRGTDPRAFSIVFDRCRGRILRPTASCQVVIAFGPKRAGAATGRLEFRDDAVTRTQTVGLRGWGTAG
jgi:YVTN family beta-propeller protein